VTDRQTDGRTDGQNYDSQDRSRICSRFKNEYNLLQMPQNRPTCPHTKTHKFSHKSKCSWFPLAINVTKSKSTYSLYCELLLHFKNTRSSSKFFDIWSLFNL